MKTRFSLILTVTVLAFGTACNKTKKVSKRFIDAGEWKVATLTVDGTAEDELPELEIEDCEIYTDAPCKGEWKNEEGGHAEFYWQFREKGETFEISHQAESEEEGHAHDHAAEEAAEQCYHFSGIYQVISSSKDRIELSSTTTVGYPGNTVSLIMEKK